MKREVLGIACLLGVATGAWAIEPGPSSPVQQDTEAWLQLQPRGVAASNNPQATTPTEKELGLQRWLKTYSHEIPDFFNQDQGGKASGSK
jgi:hypothetical protein